MHLSASLSPGCVVFVVGSFEHDFGLSKTHLSDLVIVSEEHAVDVERIQRPVQMHCVQSIDCFLLAGRSNSNVVRADC